MDRNHVSLLFCHLKQRLEKVFTSLEARNAFLCLGGVVVVCILCALVTSFQSKGLSPALLMQSSVQSLVKAKQDGDKLFALRHASEGLAYLHMARKLGSDASLQSSTGIVAEELEKSLEAVIALAHK
jgi:hypothetical protein